MFAELTRILEDFVGGSFDCGEVTIEFFKVFIDRTWKFEMDWTSVEMKGICYGDPYVWSCRLWT